MAIEKRDETNDQITLDAVYAIKKYGVGIKCSTISPDESRVKEFNLKKMWNSPNNTIRKELNGTIFREPILIKNIPKYINNWEKPIIIARHAYGDHCDSFENHIENGGTIKIIQEINREIKVLQVYDFNNNNGIIMSIVNSDESINSFAHSCFKFAIQKEYPLYLSTKNTINKIYDGRFKKIFENLYKNEYQKDFELLGIKFEHKLIDDMVAFSVRSQGGYIWAAKNYDGDVQSDFIAQGFGSLGLMTSVLISPEGCILSEVVHGTIQKHYCEYKNVKKKISF